MTDESRNIAALRQRDAAASVFKQTRDALQSLGDDRARRAREGVRV